MTSHRDGPIKEPKNFRRRGDSVYLIRKFSCLPKTKNNNNNNNAMHKPTITMLHNIV